MFFFIVSRLCGGSLRGGNFLGIIVTWLCGKVPPHSSDIKISWFKVGVYRVRLRDHARLAFFWPFIG